MKIPLIKIGNSQGVRLPASLIKQCGFKKEVEMEVKNRTLTLSSPKEERSVWKKVIENEHLVVPFSEDGEWEW